MFIRRSDSEAFPCLQIEPNLKALLQMYFVRTY